MMSSSVDFIFIIKGPFSSCPPAQTYIKHLADLGYRICLIHTPTGGEVLTEFHDRGVETIEVARASRDSRLSKAVGVLDFASSVRRIVADRSNSDPVLWIIGGDTVTALLGFLMARRGYVLSLLELHDELWHYRFSLSLVARRASALTACEINRAKIMRIWWKLPVVPFVVPNKPYSTPSADPLIARSVEIRTALAAISDKRIVLYQGLLNSERDLRPFASAISEVKDLAFVVMGDDDSGYIEDLRTLDPNVLHIPYIAPPHHMEITRLAQIGIATYEEDSLNSMFCAPNKIYEYAAFGIPMLCNRAPGLTESVGAFGAAECVDVTSREEIISGFKRILRDYDSYSSAALAFYGSADIRSTLSEVAGIALRHKSKKA